MKILLADKLLPTIGVPGGIGPLAENLDQPENILANIVSMFIGIMTMGAAIWFLFQVIISGYNYLSAGGDKERITNAGRKLTNAIIGLLIVVAAYALIALTGKILGIDFLDINNAIKSIVEVGK